jgi:hypothetical protein
MPCVCNCTHVVREIRLTTQVLTKNLFIFLRIIICRGDGDGRIKIKDTG